MHLDENMLRTIAAKAIIEGISAEQRDIIIKTAIESLLQAPPSTDPYNRDKRNRLQVAFDDSIWKASRKITEEVLEQPEYQEQIRTLVREAAEKALGGESRAGIVNAMVDGMRSALANFRS